MTRRPSLTDLLYSTLRAAIVAGSAVAAWVLVVPEVSAAPLASVSASVLAEPVGSPGMGDPPAALPAAAAHALGQSYMFLRVYDDSIVVVVEVTTKDLESALELGWDPEDVSAGQVRDALAGIRRYVEPRFALSAAGVPFATRFEGVEVLYLEVADYVVLTYKIEDIEVIPDALDIRFSVMFDVEDNHRNMLVVAHNWKTATFNNEAEISLIFSPRTTEQTLDLTSSSKLRGFLGLIRLGVWHIWIGLDHILFLVALILPSVMVRKEGKWEPVPTFREALVNIVTIVTFFTIAHSVTLSLAALDVVRLPSRLVESIIAGSIAVAAWANLVPRLNVKEWSISFVFGLFHGFGFASVLGDIGMGREHLVLSLLGFNVGVELGQVAIVCAIFPALFFLRRSGFYRTALRVGSWFLISVAMLWVFERALDFNVPLGPIILAPFRWLMGLL